MSKKFIVAAPPGATRQALLAHFGERAVELSREESLAGGELIVGDEQVLLAGEDLLAGCGAAIVIDSGYMFSVPLLKPTEQQWREHRENFDDWLRDSRESTSLWLSLMEIIASRVPLCINPPAAFEHAAMKPAALSELARHGIAVAPSMVSNDPQKIADFATNGAAHFYVSSLLPAEPGRWCDAAALKEVDLTEQAVMVQALRSAELTPLIAVGGKTVSQVAGPSLDATEAQVAAIQDRLQSPWACLTFGQGAAGPVLVDFTPSPDLGELREPAQHEVLRSLEQLLDDELRGRGRP